MTSRTLGLRNKLQNFVSSKTKNVTNSFESIELPARLKGTIIEKWLNYWKQLTIDYKDVAIDVGKDIRNRPVRSAAIGSLAYATYVAAKRNPDEKSFIESIRNYNNDMMLVNDKCHNPVAAQHLRFIEQCYNEGIIRRLSLGVVSFIWLDNYDRSVAVYKATCPYLKPQYATFKDRIIDIGFWNRWWKLEENMIDYDVNF